VAEGFKVADAFISIHADDDTRDGRRKIERDTERWSDKLGGTIGRNLGRGLKLGIGAALKGLLGLGKLMAMSLVIGAITSAIGGLVGAAGALVPVIASLAAVAATAAGALLLLPAAMLAVRVAALTVKLALQGFGDAMKAIAAEDAAKFKEALKNLAPEARQVARALRDLFPAFKEMRLGVQNELFRDLSGHIRSLGEQYLPMLRRNLEGVARVFNGIARQVIAFLRSTTTQGDLEMLFGAMNQFLSNLGRAVTPLLRILRDVLTVSMEVLAQVTGGLAPALDRIADTIARMRADGSLARLITDGLHAMGLFVRLAGDLLGILRGIFRAAGENNALFEFFDRINELVNSGFGQRNLALIFDALRKAAAAMAPVLTELLRVLGPVLLALADVAVAFGPHIAGLVRSLGAALLLLRPALIDLAPLISVVARGLKPIAEILVGIVRAAAPGFGAFLNALVDALQSLAPIAPVVGRAFGDLLRALAPLLRVLGPLLAVLLGELAIALSGLATLAEPIIRVFSESFLTLLDEMVPLMAELARQLLPAFAQAALAIGRAMEPLIPVFAELARIYADEVAEHMPKIVALFSELLELAGPLAVVLVEDLLEFFKDLVPLLPVLLPQLFELVMAMLELTIALAPLLPDLLEFLTLATQLAIQSGLLELAIKTLTIALGIAAGVIRGVKRTLDILLAPIRFVKAAFDALREAVGKTMKSVSSQMSGLGGRIKNAVGNLGSLLYNAGRNVIQGLINGIKAMFPNLGNVVSQGANIIRSFWPFSPAKRGPLSGRGDMRIAGQKVVGRLVQGMSDRLGQVSVAAARMASVVAGATGAGMGDPALAGVPISGGRGQGGGTHGPYRMILDGKVLTEFVIDTVTGAPREVAAATDEGRRQRGFDFSPRARP
jgi:phage-related protein